MLFFRTFVPPKAPFVSSNWLFYTATLYNPLFFIFLTFFTSQNELKTVGIDKVFTAFWPQKCLSVKNISSGGEAREKKTSFLFFWNQGTWLFFLRFISCFFNQFDFFCFFSLCSSRGELCWVTVNLTPYPFLSFLHSFFLSNDELCGNNYWVT